jgi:hypothetical protein
MMQVVFGKDVNEGDELDTIVPEKDKEVLKKLRSRLRGDEIELLEEMENG